MYSPDKKEFLKLAKKYNVIPVYREILTDLLTPVSTFLKVKDGYSYLLESVEGEEKIARFSFIGIDPSIVFRSKNKSPLKDISRIMSSFKAAPLKDLPRFSGGLVGYMGYDVVRFFEKLPNKNPDKLKVEDSIFMLADTLIIFDHSTHKIKVVSNAYIKKGKDKEKIYKKTLNKIDKLIDKLNSHLKRYKPIHHKKKSHKITVMQQQRTNKLPCSTARCL